MKKARLFDLAMEIAKRQGRTLGYQRTGGAGDIAIVGQAGIGVLDSLGVQGGKVHTAEEWGDTTLIPQQIDLAAEMIETLCKGND